MIGKTFSHYRIVSKLGEGAMGTVYVGEDTVLRRRVAIKMMTLVHDKQHYRMRFLREARSVSVLTHPHIAAVYDYGKTPEGIPFIVMELVEGQTLQQVIQDGTLTLSRAVEIIEKVTEALAEAHRVGIIHRDIKPSNIGISARGDVKVLDFGLAKQLNNSSPNAITPEGKAVAATQTREGVVVGTPMYLSPEQALGVEIDARSDIFAVGSLLYECVAGRPAFDGTGPIDICAKVIRDEPVPASRYNVQVPAELDRIIVKALAKKPEQRYQSAEELLQDLRAIGDSIVLENTVPRRPRVTSDLFHLAGRISIAQVIRRPHTLGITFLIALSVGITVWFVHSWRSGRPPWNSSAAEDRFTDGVNALRDGTYHKASKLFDDAIRLDGKAPLAHMGLAEALAELDDQPKAEREISLARSLAAEWGRLPPLSQLSLDATEDNIRRNLDGAVQKYEQIVKTTPDEDRVEKVRAYLDLGRVWEKRGNRTKALTNYQAAAARDPQSAAAFLHLGIVHTLLSMDQSTGTTQQALEEFAKAEKLYETVSNYEGVTEVLLQRGTLLTGQGGKGNEARSQFAKARDITRTTGSKHQEIRSLLLLSRIAATEGKTDEAKNLATEAVNLARTEGMENLTVLGLVDVGNAFLLRREYDDGEVYLKQALELAQRFSQNLNEAKAQLFLTRLYVQREFLDKALPYAVQALNFYRSTGYSRETADTLLIYGRALLLKGDYTGALNSFDQGIDIASQIPDPVLIARSHTEIGFLLASRELYPAALLHYEKSTELNRSQDDPRRTAFSLLASGDMLWRVGRQEAAATALSQATVQSERISDEYRQLFLARVFLMRARIELSQRNFPESIKNAELAQKEAGTKIQYAAIEAKYTLGLARALFGDRHKAVSLCREAVAEARKASFSEPPLVAAALLAFADAELETGSAQAALRDASEAQATFARIGRQESECRAHLTLARALYTLRRFGEARAHLTRADELLNTLRQNWGGDYFLSYTARADLRFARDQIIAALAEH
jgi:eukaryotic-like serine/threonine-protein kinase